MSAPGKVLVTGGYLVLDPDQCGLVLAVDKRFYVTAEAVLVEWSSLPLSSSEDPTIVPVEGESSTTTEPKEDRRRVVSIQVHSPQFGEVYNYEFRLDTLVLEHHVDATPATARTTTTGGAPPQNAFVQQTLQVCLQYLAPHLQIPQECGSGTWVVSHLRLTVRGDNEFWSHPMPFASSSSSSLGPDVHGSTKEVTAMTTTPTPTPTRPRFLSAPRDTAGRICKTGLGSSACLVTSLVASLYYLLAVPADSAAQASLGGATSTMTDDSTTVLAAATTTMTKTTTTTLRIANLAQLCHCRAQGKIGSGFDVSAACWGSHVYQRFDPRHVEQTISSEEMEEVVGVEGRLEAVRLLRDTVDGPLTHHCVCRALRTTAGGLVQVVLADAARGGSSSPGLSKRIWEHRGSAPWREMQVANATVIEIWLELSDAHDAATVTDRELEQLAQSTAGDWHQLPQGDPDQPWTESSGRIAHLLHRLSLAFQNWRQAFRELGVLAGVDLEPDAQAALADATCALPGVVAAVLPGAGGDDALACLYLDHPTVRDRIAAFWATREVATLDVRAVPFGEGIQLHHRAGDAVSGDPPGEDLSA